MEVEKLEFKIIMDDGADAVVLARLADLELGAAAFMAALAKHPARNVYLWQGARIIKQNLGEPKPETETPVDPNLKSWSVNLIGGRKMEHLGFVLAADLESAVATASEKFTLTPERRKRLMVNPTR